MPRHRHQRGRLHSTVSGGSSSRRNSSTGLPRPTTARMIPAAPRVDRPQLGRSLETAAYLARNRKFESTPLQRTVRISRDIPLRRRKPGLFPRVCGAEQVARSGETGVARSSGADRRQYLCRAKFQYRSVDDGDGLMRRIGQRPSRARYADRAPFGSNKSRAASVARATPAADASAPTAYPMSMRW
jgi:hypothetical protein